METNITTRNFDVIIVGLGPSGFAASKILSENGLRVLVIEKSNSFKKVCGGLLCEEAVELLSKLNVVPQNALKTNLEILDFDNFIQYDTKRILLSVERNELNKILFDNIKDNNVYVINDRVTNLVIGNRGLTVQTTKNKFQTTFVIGADGVNSIVRELIGVKNPPVISLIQAKLKVDAILKSTLFIFNNSISKTYYSYFIPKREYAIVGTKYEDKDSIKRLLETLKYLQIQFEILKYETYKLTLVKSLKDISFGKDHVLLVGEAAGFVSPSSGEGISFALESGMIAGNAIIEALESDENTILQYQRMCKSLLERLNSRIEKSKLIFNPKLRNEYFRRYYDGYSIERIREKT